MAKLADTAHERGGNLVSDGSVSPSQTNVYSALGRIGYDVQRNPEAVASTYRPGSWYSNEPNKPVFTVGPRRIGSVPQAGAVPGETTPMGRSIFGGRQAGAVGDLTRKPEPTGGNPYNSAPVARDVWGNERAKQDRSTPAGARLFGGKQRGAVGNLNPKAEPPEGGYQASKDLENFVKKSAPPHHVDPNGPTNFEELMARKGEKSMPVNPQEAEGSIYKDVPTNIAFRAWHDKLHQDLNAGFDHEGEMKVAQQMQQRFPSDTPGGAQVNIGLHQGDPAAGGRVMKPGEAVAALRSQGVKVGKTSVQTGGSEPTLVADLARPLTAEEGNAVAAKTKQSSIPQRNADGSGTMLGEGAQSAAAKAQGWDKYNPDYFQMHDGRSATEHDAEHAAYNEIKPHLTAAEQASIEGRAGKNRATAIKNLMDAFHGSTSTEGTAAMALAGQAKKGWYKNSGKAISTVYGPDAPRFAALLAAMSPQTSVEMNFRNAIHVFKAWDEAGRPTEHAAIQKVMEDNSLKNPESTSKSNVMEAWRQNGIRALTSKDPEHESFQLSGPKVNSFYQNLRDNVHEVTNDSWNALALHVPQTIFGGAYKAAPGDIFGKMGGKSPGYMGASAKVRAAASHLSNLTGETWTPHETQETLWSFAKTAMEYNENAAKQAKAAGLPKPAEKTIPELIREGKINDDLIRSTPDFAHLFALAEHSGVFGSGKFAAGAKRLAKQTRNAPEPTGPSEASAAAAKTLRPALLEQAERLEGIRQQRIADKAAGRKERQIGNVQVPF